MTLMLVLLSLAVVVLLLLWRGATGRAAQLQVELDIERQARQKAEEAPPFSGLAAGTGVEFDYRLSAEVGWAHCRVRFGYAELMLRASYLSDALGDLANAILSSLSGAEAAKCVFEEEPGAYFWQFERDGDRVKVRISGLTERRLKLAQTCSLRELAVAMLVALDNVRSEWGIDGYRKQWIEHPFPEAAHARLADFVRDGG